MNEHAGPACALSVLIVGVFAILLHDKTQAGPSAPTPPAALSSIEPRPPASPSPPARQSVPITPSLPAASQKPQPKGSKPIPSVPTQPVPLFREIVAEAPRPSTIPLPRVIVEPPARLSPRSSYTVIRPGEDLNAVALRIYGSRDQAEALWKANRDQVERVDASLNEGGLLRTP